MNFNLNHSPDSCGMPPVPSKPHVKYQYHLNMAPSLPCGLGCEGRTAGRGGGGGGGCVDGDVGGGTAAAAEVGGGGGNAANAAGGGRGRRWPSPFSSSSLLGSVKLRGRRRGGCRCCCCRCQGKAGCGIGRMGDYDEKSKCVVLSGGGETRDVVCSFSLGGFPPLGCLRIFLSCFGHGLVSFVCKEVEMDKGLLGVTRLK